MPPRFVFPPASATETSTSVEPHAITKCNLGVGEKTYVLRVRNELLYFSTPSQSTEVTQSPIWTTLFPVDAGMQNHPDALIEWWRREVEAGRFGLVAQLSGCMPIWGCFGCGQLRAWWDATGGEPFEWPNCEAAQPAALLNEPGARYGMPPQWMERWRYVAEGRGVRSFWSEHELNLWNKIPSTPPGELITRAMNRPRPAHLAEECPLQWRRGSLHEFEVLCNAIFCNVPSIWQHYQNVNLWCSTSTLVASAYIQKHMNIEEGESDGWWESNGEPLLHLLLHLLLHDFAPSGWEWKRRIGRWYQNPLLLKFSIPAPRSEHERMEARLRVRDWLVFLVEQRKLRAPDADLLLNHPQEASEWWLSEQDRILMPFEAPVWND